MQIAPWLVHRMKEAAENAAWKNPGKTVLVTLYGRQQMVSVLNRRELAVEVFESGNRPRAIAWAEGETYDDMHSEVNCG